MLFEDFITEERARERIYRCAGYFLNWPIRSTLHVQRHTD